MLPRNVKSTAIAGMVQEGPSTKSSKRGGVNTDKGKTVEITNVQILTSRDTMAKIS
jgi:hypothetical protein